MMQQSESLRSGIDLAGKLGVGGGILDWVFLDHGRGPAEFVGAGFSLLNLSNFFDARTTKAQKVISAVGIAGTVGLIGASHLIAGVNPFLADIMSTVSFAPAGLATIPSRLRPRVRGGR